MRIWPWTVFHNLERSLSAAHEGLAKKRRIISAALWYLNQQTGNQFIDFDDKIYMYCKDAAYVIADNRTELLSD